MKRYEGLCNQKFEVLLESLPLRRGSGLKTSHLRCLFSGNRVVCRRDEIQPVLSLHVIKALPLNQCENIQNASQHHQMSPEDDRSSPFDLPDHLERVVSLPSMNGPAWSAFTNKAWGKNFR